MLIYTTINTSGADAACIPDYLDRAAGHLLYRSLVDKLSVSAGIIYIYCTFHTHHSLRKSTSGFSAAETGISVVVCM